MSESPPARALVVDLDNTLYNFDDAFARSIRGLVHAISRETGFAEDAIEADIRRVLVAHGSLEYPNLIDELETLCAPDTSTDEQERLRRIAVGAFRRVRSHNLALFPGVRDTLKWAKDSGLSLIALSDAPAFQAEGRLRHFKLDGYFDALFSWEGIAASPRLKAAARTYTPRIAKRVTLSEHARKPNPDGLRQALRHVGVEPCDSYVVGDSLTRDVAVANAAGASSVWAYYGTQIDSANRETINRIFPSDTAAPTQIRSAAAAEEPWRTIHAFGELREIIGGQTSLF